MPAPPLLDTAFAETLRPVLPPERRLLLAVSGGLDSMVLWHFLRANGWSELVVCHVNHGLRGAESDADEAFVQSCAEEAGTPFESTRVDVGGHAETAKISIEEAARELRYGFFAEVARRRDCRRVVLAHHADDQVETVLINFFRGSGPRGVSGMEPVSRREVNGLELGLIRPLLEVSRAELERYAGEHGVAFREDPSNADEGFLRNRVRHRLVPLLEEIFERDVRGAVLRSAEVARRLEAWAEENVGDPPRRGDGLDVAALRGMPEGRRDRLVLAWLREEGVPDCGFGEVERVVEVLESSGKPAKANLPGGRHVRRREGVLFLE